MGWFLLAAAFARTVDVSVTVRVPQGERTDVITIDLDDPDGHMVMWKEEHDRSA